MCRIQRISLYLFFVSVEGSKREMTVQKFAKHILRLNYKKQLVSGYYGDGLVYVGK
jgi:hypothetical protein